MCKPQTSAYIRGLQLSLCARWAVNLAFHQAEVQVFTQLYCLFSDLLNTTKVCAWWGKQDLQKWNPADVCEHVKRLLSVRRRNTIYVTLAATFILGGWELCFKWRTFEGGLVHTVRIQLISDQPTWCTQPGFGFHVIAVEGWQRGGL